MHWEETKSSQCQCCSDLKGQSRRGEWTESRRKDSEKETQTRWKTCEKNCLPACLFLYLKYASQTVWFYYDFVLKERGRAWLGQFISPSFGGNWYGWNWASRFNMAYSCITLMPWYSSASLPHQDLLSRAFPHDLNFLHHGNLCTIGVLIWQPVAPEQIFQREYSKRPRQKLLYTLGWENFEHTSSES